MFEQGNSYSYISSARSALASIVSVKGFNKLSDHPLIFRFIKGVYHLRPPMPQYTYTWDINLIFEYLKTLDDNNKLDLKTLNQKLAILLLLLSGQRCSTLLSFDIEFVDLHNETCIFYPKTLLKHSRPHQTKDVFIYNKFEQEPKLCPIAAITEYIKRRTELKTTITSLFITSVPPYKTPHKDTLSRWVKELMLKSGVNTIVFKPHSCRSASTSKGKCQGLAIADILKQASWSNVNTFLKHYCRNIIPEQKVNKLQRVLLAQQK